MDKRKGQGAVEYLLILAAVLIVVAGAVYYISRTGGAPTLTATAELQADNNIVLKVQSPSGTIKAADWQYAAYAGGTQVVEWTDGPSDIAPGEEITLEAAKAEVDAGNLGAGDTIKIKHEPSGHVYELDIVTA